MVFQVKNGNNLNSGFFFWRVANMIVLYNYQSSGRTINQKKVKNTFKITDERSISGQVCIFIAVIAKPRIRYELDVVLGYPL